MSAFAYLAGRTARNWVRLQLRRLRRVRYLLALLAGGLYFWVFFFRYARDEGGAALVAGPEVVALGSLFLAGSVAALWLIRANPQALAFSDAERQHLFPAPLPRRNLVLYKLARGQLPVLLNVAIFSFVLVREGSGATPLQRALGFWVLFTILYLHRLGAALTRLGGRSRGSHLLVNVAPAIVVGSILTAIAYSVQQAMPRLLAAGSFDAIVAIVLETLVTGPAGAVLMPFRWILAPVFPAGATEWLASTGVALLILLAHLVWVLRANVAFEDAAAVAGARAGEKAARMVEGRPPPRARFRLPRLPLAPTGRSEIAMVWKNTVPVLDGLSLVMVTALTVLVGIGAIAIANRLPATVTPGLLVMIGALVGAAAATALGPFAFRYDLRNDLPRLSLLRTYPIRGENLVWSEVLGVAVPIAVIQGCLLLIALLASLGQSVVPVGVGGRFAIVFALSLLLPCVALTGVMVQNAAALLFPDWVRIGPGGSGLESTGQMLLLASATLIVTIVLLILPVVGSGAVGWLARGAGPWAVVPAAILAAVLLLVQLTALIRWLGGVYDTTDPVDAGMER